METKAQKQEQAQDKKNRSTNGETITEMKNKQLNVDTQEEPKEKKKQKVSISYTLKSFGENIKKLEENKIINIEDAKVLKEIHKKAIQYWIGTQFEI